MSGTREDVAKEFTAKGRATRNRIVDEATEIVYANGVANTSLQDVQQAAGVSGSQMYHYFPDKTLLVHAVVDRRREILLAAQAKLLERLDSLEGIRAWTMLCARLGVSEPAEGARSVRWRANCQITIRSPEPIWLRRSSCGPGCSATGSEPCKIEASCRRRPTPNSSAMPSWLPPRAVC
jgi:AcrR family transcriptional regulator